MSAKVCVITSGRAEVLRAFIRAWSASKSKDIPLYVETTKEDGIKVLSSVHNARASFGRFGDCGADAAWRLARDKFPGFSPHKQGWATKVRIMAVYALNLADDAVGIWLDHDCEVRGDLRGLAEEFLASGADMGAPLYSSMGTGRYGRTRAAQNGLFLFRKSAADLIERWWRGMVAGNMPNDESGFVLAFGGGKFGGTERRRAECALWDVLSSPRKWYASCDCFSEIHKGIGAATARLARDKESAVRHWCAKAGKRKFLELWGDK